MHKLILTTVGILSAVLPQHTTVAQSQYEPYTVKTLSGIPPGHIDGTGSAARFSRPAKAATDAVGNIYVSDSANQTIRKITPGGTVSTLAGAPGIAGSANGVGSAARFRNPAGIAVDGGGNVFVADSGNFTIRKITPAGKVSTFAGSPGQYGSADGQGGAARFYYPMGVAVDGSGKVYVADTYNYTVRKISPKGVVSTFAGKAGNYGDADLTGKAAKFSTLWDVAVSSSGNVYVTDADNQKVRKISPGRVVTTLTSSGAADYVFGQLYGLTVDTLENVYFATGSENTICKVTPDGTVTVLAGKSYFSGSADGVGDAARFYYASDVAINEDGSLFVCDNDASTIRKITADGLVSTFAGLVSPGHKDGPARSARFNFPTGIAVTGKGAIYVADNGNGCIRKISPAGSVSSLAQGLFPFGLVLGSSGNLFVTVPGSSTIDKVSPTGAVSIIAGSGQFGSNDGTGAAASFRSPIGLTVGNGGNLFVADTFNHTIRKVTPAGEVTTIAGSARSAGFIDGTGSNARFAYPEGIAADGAGNLYVADKNNCAIRKITPAGVVTTLAGSAGNPGSRDGNGGDATFNYPSGIKVDTTGNIYVADTFNSTIRKITPTGAVTTLAGVATQNGQEEWRRRSSASPKSDRDRGQPERQALHHRLGKQHDTFGHSA